MDNELSFRAKRGTSIEQESSLDQRITCNLVHADSSLRSE